MSPRSPQGNSVLHFNILPNTGIQICRGLRIPDPETLGVAAEELWEAACREAKACAQRETVRLIANHIACNQSLTQTKRTSTGWIACDPTETVFFRLTRPEEKGTDLSADLVIDTHSGAGRQVTNQIDCLVKIGRVWPFARQLHLASFYVTSKVQIKEGSLIMDFGNSGCSFIFSETGSGAMKSRVIPVNNPFDPKYRDRKTDERAIFKSNLIVLKVDKNPRVAPWLVMGERSEELIMVYPRATYLYAPKKYVRYRPEHVEGTAPTTRYRGVIGERPDFHPRLEFVKEAVSHLLRFVLSSLTNENYADDKPEYCPKFQRVMLTYPLTWREDDKKLFSELVRDEVLKVIDLPEPLRKTFQVEMVCSEPVAVAAYVLWETIFRFRHPNLALASSSLGNTTGSPELRLLVVNIGGGSTDIALIQIVWKVRPSDDSVDVTFKLLESMRFNRAGDRLSHILATAIWVFLKEKYKLEQFDFKDIDAKSSFKFESRRNAVSELARLAEEAKVAISRNEPWSINTKDDPEREKRLKDYFKSAGKVVPAGRDLRLMSSTNDASGIPIAGKSLVIVAAVKSVLHFRIFDSAGKKVVDTDETKLTTKAGPIEELRKRLKSLWTLSDFTKSDKDWVIDTVTSIAGHTPPAHKDGGDVGQTADSGGAHEREDDTENKGNGHVGQVAGSDGVHEQEATAENKDTLTITPQVFREWVEMDQQSLETEGEPGFMDIFHYLEDLRSSLADRDQLPHLTILSGRLTRLELIRVLAAHHLKMPTHRVRTLKELLPKSLQFSDYENLDKLAVVRGAQRFCFGDDIRFTSALERPEFKRFIGRVRDGERGWELNPKTILVKPGDSNSSLRTETLEILPLDTVRIGHAFRMNSPAEILATFFNTSPDRTQKVTIDILDDHTIRMREHDQVQFTEWVPGGANIIVDNFNDTGRIDREPDGFIERIICTNKDQWIVSGATHAGHQE